MCHFNQLGLAQSKILWSRKTVRILLPLGENVDKNAASFATLIPLGMHSTNLSFREEFLEEAIVERKT